MSQSQTQPKQQSQSQAQLELEREVKMKIKEFMNDFEEDLLHALNTTIQYYFVTLNLYAGSKGDYCVLNDDFYKQFSKIRDMVVGASNMRMNLRTPESLVNVSDALDEFSKLFAIFSNVDDENLVNTREATQRQLEKARCVIAIVKDYMSNKVTDKTF